MATVGGVVLHIFAVELRYVQRLRDEPVTEWDEFKESSIEDVFELGDFARGQLVDFLTSARENELDKVLTKYPLDYRRGEQLLTEMGLTKDGDGFYSQGGQRATVTIIVAVTAMP